MAQLPRTCGRLLWGLALKPAPHVSRLSCAKELQLSIYIESQFQNRPCSAEGVYTLKRRPRNT